MFDPTGKVAVVTAAGDISQGPDLYHGLLLGRKGPPLATSPLVSGRSTLGLVARWETELRLFGAGSAQPRLAWAWVDEQITTAGTYWVDARAEGHPHPRPVWGVWHEQRLHLSIGSPVLLRAMREHAAVTVHLESGTDVVIIEGLAAPAAETSAALIQAYNRKYDWDYLVARYGDLTIVQPTTVLAWRTAGWAGRESFQTTGRWVYDHR